MAELLVRAKGHWKDGWTQEYIDTLSQDEKDAHACRSRKCDIIVVRPDGWEWGREECLPNFVVVKVPSLSIDDAKVYEQHEQPKQNAKMTRIRQYYIKHSTIQKAIDDNTSVITLNSGQFNGALKDKKVVGEDARWLPN